tara:strand:- start:1252 stop:1626 length:375 start_codon:yes stop_codon:yes gene_type:complete
MTSNSQGSFQNSDSRPDGSSISSVLDKEFRLHLEEGSLTDEEVKIIAELDILLRKSYRDLEEGIEEIGADRLNGILEKLEAAPEIAVLQRTRRSIRLILWITLALSGLLAAYALLALVLKAGGF